MKSHTEKIKESSITEFLKGKMDKLKKKMDEVKSRRIAIEVLQMLFIVFCVYELGYAVGKFIYYVQH